MSKKWYGCLNNRLEENKMYCKEIVVGTQMTEYSWSDRHPYEVVKVDNQKHIWVRELDHVKADDVPMSNNWKLIKNENNPVKEMKFRYNKWNWVYGENKYSATNVSFGIAEYYYDYEF